MKYHYFVYYTFGGGAGNTQFTTDNPITSIEQIKAIGNKIMENNPSLGVVIVANFQFLRTEGGSDGR